jgi:hypothetical protein
VSGRLTATRVLAALIGAASCLAVAAFAYAAGASPSSSGGDARPSASQLPRPRILKHPRRPSLSTSVAFTYRSGVPGAVFQCRLDEGAWKACGTRVVYRGLAAGLHTFQVRVESSSGARSRAARYAWIRTEPKSFKVEPTGSDIEPLYPGGTPQGLPLKLTNPNPAAISITALRVSLAGDPPGCPSPNFELIPSNASPRKPLRVAAGASVTVPTPTVTAPAIGLRELPVSQDACQGAQLKLAFSGAAHG